MIFKGPSPSLSQQSPQLLKNQLGAGGRDGPPAKCGRYACGAAEIGTSTSCVCVGVRKSHCKQVYSGGNTNVTLQPMCKSSGYSPGKSRVTLTCLLLNVSVSTLKRCFGCDPSLLNSESLFGSLIAHVCFEKMFFSFCKKTTTKKQKSVATSAARVTVMQRSWHHSA